MHMRVSISIFYAKLNDHFLIGSSYLNKKVVGLQVTKRHLDLLVSRTVHEVNGGLGLARLASSRPDLSIVRGAGLLAVAKVVGMVYNIRGGDGVEVRSNQYDDDDHE